MKLVHMYTILYTIIPIYHKEYIKHDILTLRVYWIKNGFSYSVQIYIHT